jgi:hypothetical protein
MIKYTGGKIPQGNTGGAKMAGEFVQLQSIRPHRGKRKMKKIALTLLLAAVLLPLTAAAQQWVEPSMRPDGSMIPGHWSTTGEGWQNSFSTPGSMNPFTGQFNPYGRKKPSSSSSPAESPPSFTYMPGSNTPNPYAIPGSDSKNAYTIPGSNAPNPYSALSSITKKNQPGPGAENR